MLDSFEPGIDDELEEEDPRRFIANISGQLRPHKFGSLEPLYGSTFVAALASAFAAAKQGKNYDWSAKQRRSIEATLLWIAARANQPEPGEVGRVYLHLRDKFPQPLDVDDFKAAIGAFRARVLDLTDVSIIATKNGRSRGNLLEGLSAGLKALSDRGLLPRIEVRGMIGNRRYSDPSRPNLGELTPSGKVDWSDETKALKGLAKYLPKDSPIRHRLEGEGGLSIHERMRAVGELNRIRLVELRDCMERELKTEFAAFKKGQEFLVRTDLPSADEVASLPELRKMMKAPGNKATQAAVAARIQEIMPDDDFERRLGALVRYCVGRHGGCVAARKMDHTIAAAIGKVGFEEVIRHIEGNRTAFIAAHAIILIDTALNTSVCDKLKAQPFVGDPRRGKRRIKIPKEIERIKEPKTRAGGRKVSAALDDRRRARAAKSTAAAAKENPEEDQEEEIELDIKRLDGRMSGVEVVEMWQQMAAPIRKRAIAQGSPDAGFLWIMPGGKNNSGPIARIKPGVDTLQFRAIVRRHINNPIIGRLPITRPVIRNSVLTIQAERNGLDALAAQIKGDQKSGATTMGYINSAHLRRQLAAQIRRYLEIFEAALVSDMEDAAHRLGLPIEELIVRKELASETGLGFLCLTPTDGLRPGTKAGEICTKLEDCAKCGSRRFVPTQRSLEALYIMDVALNEQQEEFEARNPARWEAAWLPWLAMTTALIIVLKSGPYRRRYLDAAKEARAKLDAGAVAMPRLW
jgi:hypothetical protein